MLNFLSIVWPPISAHLTISPDGSSRLENVSVSEWPNKRSASVCLSVYPWTPAHMNVSTEKQPAFPDWEKTKY